jgi:hypothetical protein
VIVLSAGAFAPHADNFGDLAVGVQLEALSIMKYDAITLGDRELALGPEILQQHIGVNRSPVVCSNLRYQGSYLWDKVKVIQRGGVRIGILGMVDPVRVQQAANGVPSPWTIDDGLRVVKPLLDSLKHQVDVVLLLSQLGFWNTLELLDQCPQIEVAVVGNEGKTVREPIHYGNSLVVMSGNRGQYLGELDLTFDDEGHILSNRGKLIALSDSIPDDPEVSALVAEFKRRVEEQAARTAPVPEASNDSSQTAGGEYAGASSCQGCHPWIFTKWEVTPHRNAFQTLYREKQNTNPDCIVCHVVGYGKGGFSSVDATPQLVNVQCESCHGKGSEHVKNPKIPMPAKITETTCRECHCDRWEKGFDFSTAVKSVH